MEPLQSSRTSLAALRSVHPFSAVEDRSCFAQVSNIEVWSEVAGTYGASTSDAMLR